MAVELILELVFLPRCHRVRRGILRTQERSPPPSVREQQVVSDIKSGVISWQHPFRGRRRKRIYTK